MLEYELLKNSKSVELEAVVLGSILLENSLLSEVKQKINEDDFSLESHKLIYSLMLRLERQGLEIDIHILNLELKKYDSSGIDYNYLNKCIEAVASPSALPSYLKKLKQLSTVNQLVKLAYNINNQIAEGELNTKDIISNTLDSLYTIQSNDFNLAKKGLSHLSETLKERSQDYINSRIEGKKQDITKISTGYIDLDKMLNGGAGEGEVIIIAGRPAMGKTGLALNIALNLSINLKEKATLIYSLEMTKKSLADRILAMKTEINSYSLRTGSFEEFQDEIIKDAEKELSKLEVYISDESNLSVYKIRNDIKEKNLQGTKIGSVIIDYLQLMEGNSKDGNREKEVAQIMRQLKLLSLEFNIPVIVLSQLSRNLEQRSDKRPRLSDLRESGAIEQDCDIAMFVYRDEYYNNNSTQKGEAEILVEKHRNGPVGTVKLYFDNAIVKFKNLEGFGHG